MTTLEVKTPEETKKYIFDLAPWLTDLGTTISSVDSVTADTGLTVNSSSNTTTTITATLSGGTAGNVYKVRAQFQTGDGQVLTADIFVPVENVKA